MGTDEAVQGYLSRVLSDDTSDLAAMLFERFRREVPSYDALDADAVTPSIADAFQRLTTALREAREFTPAELAEYRAYGGLRAEQGIPLEAMLRTWQIAIHEIFQQISGSPLWREVTSATAGRILGALLSVSDQATVAFSAGHRDAEARMSRRLDSRRDDLVRALFGGRLSVDELRRQVQHFGLRLDERYAAFRVIVVDAAVVEQTEWEFRQLAACRPPHGLAAMLDGDVVGVCSAEPGSLSVAGAYVGVGPLADIDQLSRSFDIASRVAEAARLFDRLGEHTLTDMGILTAVVGNSDVGAAMCERFIVPVENADPSILQTVDCYLSTGLNASEAAQKLYLHHNTVRNRLARFEELTGASFKDAGVAVQVWWALRYREIGH
ncbi:PucR family transcriptional regulator [Nocardia jejuensis]|uniref:PucR family transcriptional regulator n=1 Tax=Nocardia jejuensis TaxID=328049 RepID=UPI00082F9645|nr:helix-turn-helix domain-containing protein [Nocardia jejuensis]